MKKFKIILAFILVEISWISIGASSGFCSNKNFSFKEGEVLNFHVYYNVGFVWINAGNVNMNVINENYKGHNVYHIVGTGKTAKSYDWFFKVRDKYESLIDRETLLPYKFLRDVNEGGVKFKNNVAFIPDENKAYSDTTAFKIPKCTHDIISAIYNARNIDYSQYKAGDNIPFNLFLDNNVYNLHIKYQGKEQIQTHAGIYNAIKISLNLIDGTIFKGGEKMTVWVSDDENHIPLRVSTPIIVGSVKMDLISYENLKNPFKAFVANVPKDFSEGN